MAENGIMDITSMPLSNQAFVFASMRLPVLQAVSNTFPEWKDLVDPILCQRQILEHLHQYFGNALIAVGQRSFVFEAIADNEPVAEPLYAAFDLLHQPLLPHAPPDFNIMSPDFIVGYMAAIERIGDAEEIEKRTLKWRNRDRILKIQGWMNPNENLMQAATRMYQANRNDDRLLLFPEFSANEIVKQKGANMKLASVNSALGKVQLGETADFQERRAIYYEYERSIKLLRGMMSPEEPYALFLPRNTTAEGIAAHNILITLLENVQPFRPWILQHFPMPLDVMTTENFTALQRHLDLEMWKTDLIRELRATANDL